MIESLIEVHMILDNENKADETDDVKTTETTETAEATVEPEKVKIEFPYSDLLRGKAPKVFEVAEKVATDWKNEGEFKDLGLPHPLAEVVATSALQKAKEVEKKLEEKGVFTLAKMGLEIAKSQVEQIKKKF